MYDALSEVTSNSPFGNFLEFRDIVVARKQPRKMFVQAHTELKGMVFATLPTRTFLDEKYTKTSQPCFTHLLCTLTRVKGQGQAGSI